MDDHRKGSVLMVQGLTQVGVIIFEPVGENLCKTVYPFRINHMIIGSPEMIPFQIAGILSVLIKLAVYSS
jgi:hypothetical protein